MSAVTVRAQLAATPRAFPNLTNPASARLLLQLRVPGQHDTLRATVHYTSLGAHGFALRDAKRMQPGDTVTVHCAGLDVDAAGLPRLWGVDHVTHHTHDEVPA